MMTFFIHLFFYVRLIFFYSKSKVRNEKKKDKRRLFKSALIEEEKKKARVTSTTVFSKERKKARVLTCRTEKKKT